MMFVKQMDVTKFLILSLAVGIANGHFFGAFDKLKKQADKNQEKIWVLLVAGSNTYMNYRHQADVCHAYQLVHGHGIPDEQIVVMMYDDIANNPENPTKGIIVNHLNGSDVYKGVPKDYTGDNVNPQTFLNVLQGKKTLTGSGKVIDSGPNDHIFVYFADHGAPGLICFPSEDLHSKPLNDAILSMHENKRYKQMVLYIEACESGSMFDGILRKDINVYATTAANPSESSYACYLDDVRNTYLGDCYSVNWMEDSDKSDLNERTLKQQFTAVKTLTTTSHVQEYGDLSMGSLKLSEFQGDASTSTNGFKSDQSDAVPARSVEFEILRRRLAAKDPHDPDFNEFYKKIMAEYNALKKRREDTYAHVLEIAEKAVNHDQDLVKILTTLHVSYSLPFGCYEPVSNFFSKNCHPYGKDDYAEQYTYVFINMCNMGISAVQQIELMKEICTK